MTAVETPATMRRARRVTPTGVLATTAAPESPEWLAVRRTGITATDLPAILGDSQYRNAGHVVAAKLGRIDDDQVGEAGQWGQLLEDTVAREWARRRGASIRRVGILRNEQRPWMLASLDRLVVGERSALEVKTRSAFVAGRWADGVPDDVLEQTVWQMAVTGLRTVHVALLIGGQQLREFTVEWDDDQVQYLVDRAAAVWQHVLDGTMPDDVPAGALLSDLLDRLHPDRAGEIDLTGHPTVRTLLAAYRSAGERAKDAEQGQAEVRSLLQQLLHDADTALVDGQPAYRWADKAFTRLATARLRKEQPELAEAYTVRGTGREFRLTAPKKES